MSFHGIFYTNNTYYYSTAKQIVQNRKKRVRFKFPVKSPLNDSSSCASPPLNGMTYASPPLAPTSASAALSSETLRHPKAGSPGGSAAMPDCLRSYETLPPSSLRRGSPGSRLFSSNLSLSSDLVSYIAPVSPPFQFECQYPTEFVPAVIMRAESPSHISDE
jgi:hypothetical protein